MSAFSRNPDGLTLHHVGIVVADIATASADYAERLGYTRRSEVIHDPVQTAFVQFLQLGAGTPYVELVSPDGPDSKLANALRKGGGLNHLCYATRDIEATCAALRRSGLALVQPPTPAVAFDGRRIAWLMGDDRVLTELVEQAPNGDAHSL